MSNSRVQPDASVTREDTPIVSDVVAKKIAEAQYLVEQPKMDKVNAYFDSAYISLGMLLKALRPALKATGLTVLQIPYVSREPTGDAKVYKTVAGIKTQIYADGVRKDLPEFLLPVSADTQCGIGAAITYARRTQLAAIFGIHGEEDHDGASSFDKVNAWILGMSKDKHGQPFNPGQEQCLTQTINWIYQLRGSNDLSPAESTKLLGMVDRARSNFGEQKSTEENTGSARNDSGTAK